MVALFPADIGHLLSVFATPECEFPRAVVTGG